VRRWVLIGVLASLALQAPAQAVHSGARAGNLPRLMLWAWERPEDLRGIGADTGVAFLAQTITVAGERLSIFRRKQPLRVSPATSLVAVTRIEIEPLGQLSLKPDQLPGLVSVVASTARLPRVRGVQVDFDATTSERPFYRNLLRGLRAAINRDLPLSITALASWCEGDDWLAGLPIDEAVPMLFRMGPVDEPFRQLARSGRWNAAPCRGSVGLSLDERFDLPSNGRRLYVFNPVPWNDSALADARRQVMR
jgi:uncharacterized protein DUF3142